MFVRYFEELPLPFEAVEPSLLADPAMWVPGLAHAAEGRHDALLAEAGFGDASLRLARKVRLKVGAPLRLPSKTIVPMGWSAAARPSLFPTLEGDLEVASLGPRRTHLSFSARYTPPLGKVGRAVDQAMLHRVAEATVKDFLDRVAERVREVAARDVSTSGAGTAGAGTAGAGTAGAGTARAGTARAGTARAGTARAGTAGARPPID